MTRRACLTAILCAVFSAVSSSAYAGIIAWIDGLSGPGSFLGFSLHPRIVCFMTQPRGDSPASSSAPGSPDLGIQIIGPALGECLTKTGMGNQRVASIDLDFGVLRALHNDLPYANPTADTRVTLLTLGPSIWWQPARSVAIGVAAGAYWFKGPAFETFSRFYVTPVQVDIKPLAIKRDASWKAEMLSVRAGYTLIPEGFIAADFGALGPFKTGHEVLPTFAVNIDLEPLFARRKAAR